MNTIRPAIAQGLSKLTDAERLELAVLPPSHALKRRTDGFAAALATGEFTGCGNVSSPQPCLATL